jgi:hypothetical protein
MTEPATIRLPFQQAFERFWIAPQTSWSRLFNPQVFISLNSEDADVENHVLEKAGSYGRQLGRVLDVLEVLVARVRDEDLTPGERIVVDRFRDLSQRVDAAVEDYRGPQRQDITRSDVDRVAEGLRSLSRTDPAAWKTLSDRLRPAVAPDSDPAVTRDRAPETPTASRSTRARG